MIKEQSIFSLPVIFLNIYIYMLVFPCHHFKISKYTNKIIPENVDWTHIEQCFWRVAPWSSGTGWALSHPRSLQSLQETLPDQVKVDIHYILFLHCLGTQVNG